MSKAKHAGTHVVAHVVIPWLIRGAVIVAAPVLGSVGLNIGPIAHVLHVSDEAPATTAQAAPAAHCSP